MIKTLLASTIALLAASTSAETLPAVALPPEVARVLVDYSRAWAAADLTALARLFAPEGMALPNGMPPAVGADSIRRAYAQSAGAPLVLRPIAFGSSGDLAYVIGGFGPAADKPDFGKFTLVLRRSTEGHWRIVSDMDNSNGPAQPSPSLVPKP
ncbi:DUF4440 domain-containing protein [Nostoc sp. NIES-2111]